MSLLEIENLSLAIGDTPILKGVELSVAPGEVMGLVGESGSGKTTVGQLASGLRVVGQASPP